MSPFKEGPDGPYYVPCDVPEQIVQNDLDDFSGRWPSIAERYMRNELQIWVRFRARFLIGDDGDYLAVCEWPFCEDGRGGW